MQLPFKGSYQWISRHWVQCRYRSQAESEAMSGQNLSGYMMKTPDQGYMLQRMQNNGRA